MSKVMCAAALGCAAAVAATPLAAAPAAVASGGAAAGGSTWVNRCAAKVAGRTLAVKVTSHFTSEVSNDLTRVTVRATDADETGRFHNAAVQVTRLRIVVLPKSGPRIARSGTSSPQSLKLDPTSHRSGRDALGAMAKVTFTVNGTTTTRMACADIDT